MPRRNQKFDYSLPVDGSNSQTDWKGLHKLDEIVHVYNPASGWIQNCNSTPFTSAGKNSPKKENYPAYMAPDGQNFRAINAMRLLEGKNKFTFDQLIHEVGYSHYLAAFEVLLPPLIKAWEELAPADSMKEKLREAIVELKNWDLNASENSIATTLAVEWATKMQPKASAAANPYQQSDVTGQIQSMISNTSSWQKLQLFDATLNEISQRFGTWKQTWGSVNRYQRKVNDAFSDQDSSFAVGLGAGTWGSIPSFATRRFPQTSKRYGISGNSFIACVEFGKKLKAKTIITGGQSFDPASPHYTDQARGYIQGNLKEINFYKLDVLRHAEKQYHPGE
jgi:acyl-homoserine lactone acylase PvdQ